MARDHALYDLMDSGASFDEVERWIEGLPASVEEKSVLWLLAWSEAYRWYPRPARHDLLAQARAAVG